MQTVRIIGPGRAGCSLSAALPADRWEIVGFLGRHDDPVDAARGADVVVIATPDDAVAAVAAAIRPRPGTVVLHLSGSLGTDVLAPHTRRAALHPLIPLPTPAIGATRLLDGCTFAVSGDPVARLMAEDLGGRIVEVADADRATYHAAACIAANHVVALLGQVERVAGAAGLDLEAFLGLTRAAVEDVASLGARSALTGPAARGDWATLSRHRDALALEEQSAYNAGVGLAVRLASPAAAAATSTATAATTTTAMATTTTAMATAARVDAPVSGAAGAAASAPAVHAAGETGAATTTAAAEADEFADEVPEMRSPVFAGALPAAIGDR